MQALKLLLLVAFCEVVHGEGRFSFSAHVLPSLPGLSTTLKLNQISKKLDGLDPSRPVQRLRGGSDTAGETQKTTLSASPEENTVTFKRKANTKYGYFDSLQAGEFLWILGNCPALGDMDQTRAIRMKKDAETNEWSAVVPQVPMGARYRYMAACEISDKRALTSYSLQVHSGHLKNSNGELLADDTTQLARFEVNKNAGDVRVVGSSAVLGGWVYDKGLQLEKSEYNKWSAIVAIPSDEIATFEYKYVADGKYEDGPNRRSDLHSVDAMPECEHKMVSTLKAVFNGLLIRFIMFHPLAGADERMCITGGHPAFGSWGKPEEWLEMGLGNVRTLLTNELGRCWEATFPATLEDVTKCAYRYIIRDSKTRTAVWESEPNRFLELIPGTNSGAAFEDGFRRREWTRFDGNFVAKELGFNWIPPNMYIGAYPQCHEDVVTMKAAGVTGVVNVQTDHDILKRMINMDVMRRLYNEAGIELRHVPIEDFNGDSLAARVKHAAHAVHELSEKAKCEGKEPKIYIHCTAGMGRAPATACIYLVWKHGYNLDHARNHVKHHRPIVAPNYDAMKRACQMGLDH